MIVVVRIPTCITNVLTERMMPDSRSAVRGLEQMNVMQVAPSITSVKKSMLEDLPKRNVCSQMQHSIDVARAACGGCILTSITWLHSSCYLNINPSSLS